MKKMMKFDNWDEALEWAQETDRSLEPVGTYTGDEDERMTAQYNHGDHAVEMWERVAEVSAIGDRNIVGIGVREYLVVVRAVGTDYNLIHADSKDEAEEVFDREVNTLIQNNPA